jgi:hypothetical protein
MGVADPQRAPDLFITTDTSFSFLLHNLGDRFAGVALETGPALPEDGNFISGTSSGKQYNRMTTSVGYASSSDGPVHFGLGSDSIAQSIEIHWPSGKVQTFQNVRADQIFKVTEK